jgi:hypothetical protein
MKAKKLIRRSNQLSARNFENALPQELGAHLFAMIKRNLQLRRRNTTASASSQMTFAF